ncbi:AraC family transcriptional regulator [Streptomyces sp. NPDC048172]|uniref:helix-turn-helix transcriptional regulator n=1 Tax=Streptomyces sp. NPDC048172 TaxID=3365505 RepID=UPI0037121242
MAYRDDTPPTTPDPGLTFRLRSDDVDAARSLLTAFYGVALTYRPLADVADFAFRMQAARVGPVNVGLLGFGTESSWMAPPQGSFYSLCFPRSGKMVLTQQDKTGCVEEGRRSGTMVGPFAGAESHLASHSDVLILGFDRYALQQELEGELERSVTQPLEFPFSFGCDGPVRLFFDQCQMLADELAGPHATLGRPSVAERLGSALLTTMLHVAPHQYAEALANPAAPAPRQVKRAVEAMEADPAHPFTATELARAAGVSVRSLQRAFQSQYGMTPLAFLRRLRLERARQDLAQPQAPGTTVADIALRWGFLHPSRFAARYRERYGTLPSRELRH